MVGAVLILAFERYRPVLHEWLLADPGAVPVRIRSIVLLLGVLALAPLLGFAAYLRSIAVRVILALEFPPPAYE